MTAIHAPDDAIIRGAHLSAWFCFQARGTPSRCVSKDQELGSPDPNRLVMVLNHARWLNAPAALAITTAAATAGMSLYLDPPT